VTVLYDYFPYGIEFFWGKTLIPRQYNGLHPEFAYHPFSLNMHMHLLVAIEAVKEKPVWPWNILDCLAGAGGHPILPLSRGKNKKIYLL